MKHQGIWAVSFFAFLVAWRVLAADSTKIPTHDFDAAEWTAADGWWTCYIERPDFYYIGWAHERTDAVDQAIEACKEDGIECTADEAVCQRSDEK